MERPFNSGGGAAGISSAIRWRHHLASPSHTARPALRELRTGRRRAGGFPFRQIPGTGRSMQCTCCVSFCHEDREYSNTAKGWSLFDVAAKALEFFCAPHWNGVRVPHATRSLM
jgi:hypothetical protein